MIVNESVRAALAYRRRERDMPESAKIARDIAQQIIGKSCSVTQVEDCLTRFAQAIIKEANLAAQGEKK